GRPIRGLASGGWAWWELGAIDPAAGGAGRAEGGALRLIAIFLGDWGTKSPNPRLVCLSGEPPRPGGPPPLAVLHDAGPTLGPRGVDLDGWRRTPIWTDAATCTVSMKGLPYQGATFVDARIGEAGRRLLADELRQLSPAQVRALFAGARFSEFAKLSREGR